MLFRKKLPRSCAYCSHSVKLEDGQFLCAKKGLLKEDLGCRRFRYDPLKRVPPRMKAMDFSKYDDQDFSL